MAQVMASYDAMLIPGGGVRAGGVLPSWVAARFDHALAVCGNAFLMPLSAGTTHRPPPLDERGFPITEAAAGARYLVERGIEPGRILLEAASFDTIGNAYFSRVVHVMPRGFGRLLVITSEFHMPRAEAVFRWVYSLEGPGSPCSVDFLSTPNTGIDDASLHRRMAKESASLELFEGHRSRIGSLAELHHWLFADHAAYAARVRPAESAVDLTTY
jgi:uncharacterized SAM-binding protein YcdF (DUF218 family)